MDKERLYKKYENEHRARLKKYGAQIDLMYKGAIDAAADAAEGMELLPGVFDLKKYPRLNNRVNKIIERLNAQIETFLYTSIAAEWAQSEFKNDAIFDFLLKRNGKKSPLINLRTDDALKSFIERRDKQGLNLSQKVYKHGENFKNELEAGLGDGIAWGKSAQAMGRDLKKYLYEPDKLFRRIRKEAADGTTKLRLSKPALDYKPGQGVYRSSAKNIQRLTRTETNMSYRRADMERYKRSPFIIGYEVKLSLSHPAYDICDQLQGRYPVNFVFVGWHPQCLCYNTPILLTPEQYDRMESDLLAGKDIYNIKYTTEPVPDALQLADWYKDNKEKISGWKSTPYFIKDNPSFFKETKSKEFSISELSEAIKKNQTIETIQGKNWVLSEERRASHNKIVKDYLGSEKVKSDTVYMLGGAPANGKSTLVDSGLLPHPKGALVLDPDKIKGMIPEYQKMLSSGNTDLIKGAANFIHEESSYLGKIIKTTALKNNYATVIDGVNDGGIDDVIKKANDIRIESGGKKIRADFVSLDTDLSVKLAKARSAKTGREVPLPYIEKMNSEISHLIPKIIDKKVYNELYLWDTNTNGVPNLILTQIDGVLKIHDKELYKRFLLKAK